MIPQDLQRFFTSNLTSVSYTHLGLILSYFSDYLFPQVYAGIESVLRNKSFEIDVAVTRNRLNDEEMYLKGFLSLNVAGLIM